MPKRNSNELLTTYELAVSNSISVEAVIRVLMRKGLLAEGEILEEIEAVRAERRHRPQGEA